MACSNPDGCGCTPDTIRATTSSVTDCIGQCITGATESYKLAGTTAVNGTHDTEQLDVASCTWRHEKASDHVLTRATKYSLSTLTYRATKTSSTNWHMEVFASGGGQTVYFFDGNVTVAALSCVAAATANNALACDLCAATKTAGNSGTFAKPLTVAGVTVCANCLNPPQASWSATIADVVTCLDTCECTNRWKLTGSTEINRSITLTQVGGSPCVFEGTVAADYVLYDHDTAAASFGPLTLRYDLVRTGATTATWKIVGMDGATERVTYASGTSAVSANDCKTWGTSTHTNPGCSANSAANTAVMGTAGSTTFLSCP